MYLLGHSHNVYLNIQENEIGNLSFLVGVDDLFLNSYFEGGLSCKYFVKQKDRKGDDISGYTVHNNCALYERSFCIGYQIKFKFKRLKKKIDIYRTETVQS